MSQSLLINGDIINPPSSITCVRDITFVAHEYLELNVIIECNSEKDFYYKFLKTFGAMDYVDDLTVIGEEQGMRVDTEYNFAPTVYVTDKIDHDNISDVLKAIGFCKFIY